MGQNKDYSISLLRLIATILIFCSHIFTFGLGSYICDIYFPFYFGVDIFLCISAFLYANKEIKKGFLKKQFTKILVPVFIYVIILLSIQLITNSFDIAVFGNLWYIAEILICYLLLPFLNNIKQGIHQKISLFVVSFVVIVECVLSIFTTIQICIVCFVLAYYMSVLLKDKLYSLSLFFVILFILSCFAYFYAPVVTLKHYFCFVMGICFSFAFLSCFKIEFNKRIRFLDVTDKYSYSFYITQQCLMLGVLSVIHITNYFVLNVFIIFIINLILCFLLTKVSNCIIKLLKNTKNPLK